MCRAAVQFTVVAKTMWNVPVALPATWAWETEDRHIVRHFFGFWGCFRRTLLGQEIGFREMGLEHDLELAPWPTSTAQNMVPCPIWQDLCIVPPRARTSLPYLQGSKMQYELCKIRQLQGVKETASTNAHLNHKTYSSVLKQSGREWLEYTVRRYFWLPRCFVVGIWQVGNIG